MCYHIIVIPCIYKGEHKDMNTKKTIGIAAALVRGYKDGQGAGSVSLTIKHFPGDGASWNGFESHS